MTDLIIIEELNALEIFVENGLEKLISAIELEVAKFVPDMTSEEGRKEIASMAYKVAKSKTALDNLGKDLVSEWKTKSKAVDSVRKIAWDKLEAMQHKVRKPLTDWENAEKLRVEERKARMQQMIDCANVPPEAPQHYVEEQIRFANSLYQFDWQEFQDMAQSEYDRILAYLNANLERCKKADIERAELEKLRKEAAERAVKDREELIAKEAAERATLQAEAASKAILEKAERELKEAVDENKKINEGWFNVRKQPESISVVQGLHDEIEKIILAWVEKYKINLTKPQILELTNNLQATLVKQVA